MRFAPFGPGDRVARGVHVVHETRLERLDDPPAGAGTALQALAEGLLGERPDCRPDHELVALDERDRAARERHLRAQPVEGLVEDVIQVALARSRGRDVEDEL